MSGERQHRRAPRPAAARRTARASGRCFTARGRRAAPPATNAATATAPTSAKAAAESVIQAMRLTPVACRKGTTRRSGSAADVDHDLRAHRCLPAADGLLRDDETVLARIARRLVDALHREARLDERVPRSGLGLAEDIGNGTLLTRAGAERDVDPHVRSRRTCVPPAGNSETTVPRGRCDATGKESTVSPTCSMRSTASPWLRPTTFGTTTRPAGLPPFETLIPTIEPFGALLPGAGVWEITIPFGDAAGTCDTLNRKPSLLSVAVADAWVRPLSGGNSGKARAPSKPSARPSSSSSPGCLRRASGG